MDTSSYIRATCSGLHDRWIETIKDLRLISDKSTRDVYIQELRDIYKEAQQLSVYSQHIHPLQQCQLTRILSRPIDQVVVLYGHQKQDHNLVNWSSQIDPQQIPE